MAMSSGNNRAPLVVNGMVAEGGVEKREMEEKREERNGKEEDGLRTHIRSLPTGKSSAN